MLHAARYLVLAQTSFFFALVVCVIIDPEGLHNNHGWSYYEEHVDTVVPYVLGVLGLVFLTLYAASLLEQSAVSSGLPRALRWLTVFLLLDIATPDAVDTTFYWAHNLASTLLFLYELGVAVWLVCTVVPTHLGVGLLSLQFAGGLTAMFSQFHLIALLGEGILVFQLSFGVLLVVAVRRLSASTRDELDDELVAPATTG